MQANKSKHSSTHLGGLGSKIMNVHILNNLHARQKWNEKKALD
jgi:hypothetical protein